MPGPVSSAREALRSQRVEQEEAALITEELKQAHLKRRRHDAVADALLNQDVTAHYRCRVTFTRLH